MRGTEGLLAVAEQSAPPDHPARGLVQRFGACPMCTADLVWTLSSECSLGTKYKQYKLQTTKAYIIA